MAIVGKDSLHCELVRARLGESRLKAIREMTNKERMDEFHSAAARMANELIYMAALLTEFEADEGDVGECRASPMANLLRRIDCGQTDPDFAAVYMESDYFEQLSELPLGEQKRIADDPTIPVVVDEQGSVKRSTIDELLPHEFKRVFDPKKKKFRSAGQQSRILAEENKKNPEVDPFLEARTPVRITADIDLTKAQKVKLEKHRVNAGSMSALLVCAFEKLGWI